MRRWLNRHHQVRTGSDDRGATTDWAERQLVRRGISDPDVIAAMRAVPRERFVPSELAKSAYDDGALPIGHGQTISQPYMVALMTQALQLSAWSAAHGERPKVLDVGTGSGYQAAVLAALDARVVSIEREPDLAQAARARLTELGYEVKVIVGDGSGGAPEEAPFAAIVVGAAAPDVPAPLVEQLSAGGRLVVPLGTRSHQVLTVVTPTSDGFSRQPLESAVFVPLVGDYGFDET